MSLYFLVAHIVNCIEPLPVIKQRIFVGKDPASRINVCSLLVLVTCPSTTVCRMQVVNGSQAMKSREPYCASKALRHLVQYMIFMPLTCVRAARAT